MTEREKQIFKELCESDRILHAHDGDCIGTYNEKRFHRVLKRLITEDASCYEVKLGKYVADVLLDGCVTEIQTGSFRALAAKVGYYLENTDLRVCVVKPIITEKKVIRADKETGEIRSVRRSPRHETVMDAISEIYYLRDYVKNERLSVRVLSVSAEEYRYSDRVRYRRSGAYDNDVFPIEITDERIFCGTEDYLAYLPTELVGKEFTTADYTAATGLCGRPMYSILNILCAAGVLHKQKTGKHLLFF